MRPCESQELVTRLASSLRPLSREREVMAGTSSTREREGSVREEIRESRGSNCWGKLTATAIMW